jgi:hypothetical protein
VPIGEVVSQISPPIRIVLVCAVAFLAAWMLFLRPKAPTASAPAAATPAPNVQTGAPAQSFAGKMAQRAKKAVATANGASSRVDAASGGQAQATTHSAAATEVKANAPTSAPAIPAGALKALPKDVAHAVRTHKVLVLGVVATRSTGWRPAADDDVAVRAALRHVNRYDGDVFVKRVSLAQLTHYGPLFGALQLNQTPSVVVIDRNLKGTVIAGYLDRIAINQAIVDARRASTKQLITDRFLQRVNTSCARFNMLWDRFPLPANHAERKTFAKRLFALAGKERRAFAAIPAAKRWQPLKARILRDQDANTAIAHKMLRDAKAKNWSAFVDDYQSIDFGELTKLDRKLNSVGATACVGNRRS